MLSALLLVACSSSFVNLMYQQCYSLSVKAPSAQRYRMVRAPLPPSSPPNYALVPGTTPHTRPDEWQPPERRNPSMNSPYYPKTAAKALIRVATRRLQLSPRTASPRSENRRSNTALDSCRQTSPLYGPPACSHTIIAQFGTTWKTSNKTSSSPTSSSRWHVDARHRRSGAPNCTGSLLSCRARIASGVETTTSRASAAATWIVIKAATK